MFGTSYGQAKQTATLRSNSASNQYVTSATYSLLLYMLTPVCQLLIHGTATL